MAKRKFSELTEMLKAAGVDSLDELIDDESGLPYPEVLKRLKANQEGFTKATQESAREKAAREQREGELQQAINVATQWKQQAESYGQALNEATAAAKGRAAQTGEDWRTDPILQPAAQYYDEKIGKINELLTVLGQGVASMIQENNKRWATAATWGDGVEIDRLKAKYPDFDVEQVKAAARRSGINSWEGAYTHMKGEGYDDRIKTERAKWDDERKTERETIRAEALKEYAEKGHTPETEMGSTGTTAPPVGGADEKPKQWGDAWKGLAKELEGAGIR